MQSPAPFLLIVKQGDNRQTFSFAQDEVTVGRSNDCDLTLSDRVVSRHHCHVERVDDKFFVVHDAGQNPVLLRGQAVERAEIRPGETAQRIHRDEDAWPQVPPEKPQLEVEAMFALTDFTLSNGATQVVPGSHLWAPDRQPTANEITYAEMPAGSALVSCAREIAGGSSRRRRCRPSTGNAIPTIHPTDRSVPPVARHRRSIWPRLSWSRSSLSRSRVRSVLP